jgi:hypothetical protein
VAISGAQPGAPSAQLLEDPCVPFFAESDAVLCTLSQRSRLLQDEVLERDQRGRPSRELRDEPCGDRRLHDHLPEHREMVRADHEH